MASLNSSSQVRFRRKGLGCFSFFIYFISSDILSAPFMQTMFKTVVNATSLINQKCYTLLISSHRMFIYEKICCQEIRLDYYADSLAGADDFVFLTGTILSSIIYSSEELTYIWPGSYQGLINQLTTFRIGIKSSDFAAWTRKHYLLFF